MPSSRKVRPNRPALRDRTIAAQLEEVLAYRQLGLREWSELIPTARGKPLDFERFPFQRELYDTFGDPTIADIVVMKSVQVGVSELLTRLTLYFAAVHQSNALYVFPALRQMHDFSDARVDRLVEKSEYLREIVKPRNGRTWNKGLKQVGEGIAYFRGAESKNDLIAVDADVLALDEYDQLDPENVPEAEKRVAGSALGLIRRVGIPSDPDFGIAKLYERSDKRRWLVKCPSSRCSERWQPLTFDSNVTWSESEGVVSQPAIVCRGCKRPLDVLAGKWAAEHPERRKVGFHVHRLMDPSESNLLMVIEDSKQTDPARVRAFWNSDLGLPYSESDSGLDRAAIAAAVAAGEEVFGSITMVSGYSGANLVTMGIDVASTRALNVRISEHIDPLEHVGHRKRGLWIGTVDSFDELARLMHAYAVTYACIDGQPERRLANAFADRFPGRVFVVHYTQGHGEPLVVRTADREVSAHRTAALDASVSLIRERRNLLPSDLPRGYVEQMISTRRVVRRDEYDRTEVRWQRRGADDYFHAEAYDLLAAEVAKHQRALEYLRREETWQLDEELDFIRSNVNDYDSMDYRPGPYGGYYDLDG